MELRRRIGQGVTSVVWLARHGEAELAVKIARSSAHAALLADEASRLLLVDSPALTDLVDAGFIGADWVLPHGQLEDACVSPGAPYVALEWVDGKPTADLLPVAPKDRVPLALAVARDVAAALRDLHRAGSSHGDVKPANVVANRLAGEAQPWRAKLVDLGLSGEAEATTPRGGTPRYLAPEVLGIGQGSDGRARDLWALGLTVAEIACPDVAVAPDPAAAVSGQRFSAALELIVRPLMAQAPAARPSAEWVHARASDELGYRESAQAGRARRERAVRRSYLAIRRREVLSAAQHREARIAVTGEPGQWLTRAVNLARRVALLRGDLLPGNAEPLSDLDALGRSRWLVHLVGSPAASWPCSAQTDAELCDRLLALAEEQEPESFTLADLERRSSPPRTFPADPVDVALALGGGNSDPRLWDIAERMVLDGGPASLGVALGRALRLNGQLGRALAVLRELSTPEAAVEAAETARRARDADLASAILRTVAATADPQTVARGAATQARLTLDRGDARGALGIIESAPDTAATLEVRALAELAADDHAAARHTAERARALAESEEERARIQAVVGFSRHAAGEAESALQAFSQASEHAARAGAVLEEATYLTGVAAAAADLGYLDQALVASGRAVLLFEHLSRPREAARAALSRAAVFALAGAVEETRDAARDAITRARAADDGQCRAYAHLALADVLPEGDTEAVEHAQRAVDLLRDAGRDDALRAGARVLRRGGEVDGTTLDAVGRDRSVAATARLEWWGARAWVAARHSETTNANDILTQLNGLAASTAPVAVRGPALSAGSQLAAIFGDGDMARALAQRSAETARQLLGRAPPEMRSRLAALPWINAIRSPRESLLSPEQINDIDNLIRALGRRDRLRPLLDQVLDALVLWTGVERGLLLLRAPGGRLVPRAARNLARADLTGEQLQLSRSLAERALALEQPVVAVDATGELPEVHASVHSLRLRSVLAVPLLARGEALGVVYLDDRVRRGAFGARELGWVRLVATVAAVAIADARDQLLLRRAARRAQRAEARLAQELARREVQLDLAERELARTRSERDTRFAYSDVIGRSEPVRAMLKMVDRVTTADVPVLLIGESGSGKELIARAIHDNGPRRKAPFVTENCGAIPEGLLESALFGHVRGAFTGALRPRAGLFEVADTGTLFLDEIAEMSLGMQTKLLRVLEDGEIRPVGSERGRRVQVRVIGATHRHLDKMVADGAFREDLFYRLNVITIPVPPLRERPGDIELLVLHFLAKHAGERTRRISKEAMAALSACPWPGNIRQLENEIRRALVLSDGVIDAEHLSADVVSQDTDVNPHAASLNVRVRVDRLERELVRKALEQTAGNQTRAAELLGLSRFGLQKMMKRLEISSRKRSQHRSDKEPS